MPLYISYITQYTYICFNNFQQSPNFTERHRACSFQLFAFLVIPLLPTSTSVSFLFCPSSAKKEQSFRSRVFGEPEWSRGEKKRTTRPSSERDAETPRNSVRERDAGASRQSAESGRSSSSELWAEFRRRDVNARRPDV